MRGEGGGAGDDGECTALLSPAQSIYGLLLRAASQHQHSLGTARQRGCVRPDITISVCARPSRVHAHALQRAFQLPASRTASAAAPSTTYLCTHVRPAPSCAALASSRPYLSLRPDEVRLPCSPAHFAHPDIRAAAEPCSCVAGRSQSSSLDAGAHAARCTAGAAAVVRRCLERSPRPPSIGTPQHRPTRAALLRKTRQSRCR